MESKLFYFFLLHIFLNALAFINIFFANVTNATWTEMSNIYILAYHISWPCSLYMLNKIQKGKCPTKVISIVYLL